MKLNEIVMQGRKLVFIEHLLCVIHKADAQYNSKLYNSKYLYNSALYIIVNKQIQSIFASKLPFDVEGFAYIHVLTMFFILSVILSVKRKVPLGKDTLDQNDSTDLDLGTQRSSNRICGMGDMSTESGNNIPGRFTSMGAVRS